MTQRRCMASAREEIEEFLRASGVQIGPPHIDLMVQYPHCFPLFPVIPYVAAQVFGMTSQELKEILSSNVDNVEE